MGLGTDCGPAKLRGDCRAAHILASIGDEAAFEPIAGLLASTDDELRVRGIEALEVFGSDTERFAERSLPLVEQCLDDPSKSVRDSAESVLAEIRGNMEHPEECKEPPTSWKTRLIASEKRRNERFDRAVSRQTWFRRRGQRRFGMRACRLTTES